MSKNIILYGGLYYALINLVLFACMGIDKRRAVKHKWRISEAALLIMGLFGGSIGAFIGMRIFHHKTRKAYFYIVYISSLILHIMLIYLVLRAFGVPLP